MGISKAQAENAAFRLEMVPFEVSKSDEEAEEASFTNACNLLAESEFFSAIVDLTWRGWKKMHRAAEKGGMPYIRLESSNRQFVKVGYYFSVFSVISNF